MRFRLFGRSEAIRTPGLLDPNQARYQLRYTPMDPYIIMRNFQNVKAWQEKQFLSLRQNSAIMDVTFDASISTIGLRRDEHGRQKDFAPALEQGRAGH